MLYFIPWVVFLLAVILAVPITAWLEKRKFEEMQRPADEDADQMFEPDQEAGGEAAMAEEGAPDAGEGSGEAEMADGEFAEAEGGEDFSAFDEIK